MNERRNHRIVVTARGGPEVLQLVDERIPLAEAARAHELLAHGRHAGKVVLTTGSVTEGSEASRWM